MQRRLLKPTPTDDVHKDRLMRFIVPGAEPDDCWEWTGDAIKDGGHGRIRVHNKEYVASRLSYAVHNGVDPGAKSVCHRCDNPLCTNPRHLFLGTHLDNMRDAAKKQRFSRKPRRGNFAVGDNHPTAKLTDAQVATIRQTYWSGDETQRQIAARFGVTQGTISAIVRGGGRRGDREEMIGDLIVALDDMIKWVAAFARGNGIADYNIVMRSPRMAKARFALENAKHPADSLREAAAALELDELYGAGPVEARKRVVDPARGDAPTRAAKIGPVAKRRLG